MDESKLRHFVSVVQHKSFASAAQEHHMVASTISRSVAALEEELGAPLFYRTPNSIELTLAGRRLYEASHGYLRQFSLIHQNALNLIHEKEHRLLVGGGPPHTFALITRLGNEYRKADPDVEISHVYNSNTFISSNMLHTDARLYITMRAVADTLPSCETVSLGVHRYAAVTHRDSPFWSLPPDRQAILWNQKVVMSTDSYDPIRPWLEQRVMAHRGHSTGRSYTSICAQAMQGRIAILPEYMEPWLPRELRMAQIFPAPLQVESVLIFNRERATPLETDFFEYIRDHYKP